MRPLRSTAFFVAALTLVVTGCSSNEAAPATGTIAPDPYAVPLVIDEAYVEKVLTAMGSVRKEMPAHINATGQSDAFVTDRVRALYGEPALSEQLEVWADSSPLTNLKPNAGPAKYSVERLLSATNECIWARVSVDDSANQVRPAGATTFTYVLRNAPHDRNLNPTPFVWVQALVDEIPAEEACG